MKTIAINIPSNLTKVEDIITAIKVYGHKNAKYRLSVYGKEELLITLEGVEGISINKGKFNPLSNFLNDKEVIGLVDFESKNELVSTYKNPISFGYLFNGIDKTRQTIFLLLPSLEKEIVVSAINNCLLYLKRINMEVISTPRIGYLNLNRGNPLANLKEFDIENVSFLDVLEGKENIILSLEKEGTYFLEGINAAATFISRQDNKRVNESKNPFTRLFVKKDRNELLISTSALVIGLDKPLINLPLNASYSQTFDAITGIEKIDEAKK